MYIYIYVYSIHIYIHTQKYIHIYIPIYIYICSCISALIQGYIGMCRAEGLGCRVGKMEIGNVGA